MTRCPFRILICLLLGVVTTVGVAWGLALSSGPLGDGEQVLKGITNQGAPRWVVFICRSFGSTAVCSRHDELRVEAWQGATVIDPGSFATWTRAAGEVPESVADGVRDLLEDARGVPFRALISRTRVVRHTPPGVPPYYSAEDDAWWAIQLNVPDELNPMGLYDYRVLPLRPIWPGFLINTVFYAALYGAAWFVPVFVFTRARRAIRQEQGMGPLCGYDLRGEFDNVRVGKRVCVE